MLEIIANWDDIGPKFLFVAENDAQCEIILTLIKF